MDQFGIGAAINGAARIYFISARSTGRTTSLLDSVKNGDRICFSTAQMAKHFERLSKEHGVDVECVVVPPKEPERVFSRGRPRGRTIFDHEWIEQFYLLALDRAQKEIDHLERQASGQGGIGEVMPQENQPGVSRAVQAIADERQRQISSEGYSAYRDDGYTRNELADAAACYATLAGCKGSMTTLWPWSQEAFKLGTDRRRDLIKAAALIVAEIERIDRAGLIQREIVRRDDMGFWTHTAWPKDGDEDAIPIGWFPEHGLEVCLVEMDGDGPEEMSQQWLDAGLIDCTPWEPSAPPGDGWFVFSIHDTEDGPVCVWVRHKVSP